MSTLIPLDLVIVHERHKPPYSEPRIIGHYRRWLLGRLRTGTLPSDYAAWHNHPDAWKCHEITDHTTVDFSALNEQPETYKMYRTDAPTDPTKPWIILDANGLYFAKCSTPHEAEGLIGKLIAKSGNGD